MVATQYGDRKFIVLGQVFAIVFALVLAFYPQYYWPILIAYFIVFFLVMVIMQRRGRGPIEEVLSGRELYREDKAAQIMLSDPGFVEEYSAQTKSIMKGFMLTFAILLVFWVIFIFKDPIVDAIESIARVSKQLAYFIFWLSLFEVFFIVNRLVILRAQRTSTQPLFIAPRSFIVTDKGIAAPGLMGFALRFPLPENSEVKIDSRRRFVEIIESRSRRIRLYTSNPKRLYELIKRLNEKHKREREGTARIES